MCELSDNPPEYFHCPVKPLPPGNPHAPFVDIVITIQFDDYPSETGWVLESMPDFRNIVFRPFGTYKSKSSMDENNSMSEKVSVQSGRFYMLSVLDEFADGFCCSVGEGSFRVESGDGDSTFVDTTPGILMSSHALRRTFYVEEPNGANSPDYVTIVVTPGIGADPSRLLLVALDNMMYETLMLYEIRPFMVMNDSRTGTGGVIASRIFKVPVLGVEFGRQRYNVLVYDDNEEEASKASFEVYLGDIRPSNLLLAQSGNYGSRKDISRSFVLFKKEDEETSSKSPSYSPKTSNDANLTSTALANSNAQMSFFLTVLLMTTLSVNFSIR